MLCKKGALRNFVKLTGKHLCQSLFFNKVADKGPAKWISKWRGHGTLTCIVGHDGWFNYIRPRMVKKVTF